MKFNFTAFAAVAAAVIASALVSWAEGTLTAQRVTMGFINHGGMWGDLLLVSTVIGLVFPWLSWRVSFVVPTMALAAMLTVLAHRHWAIQDVNTEHMFPTHTTGKWYLDMSVAGWMHMVLMTFLMMTIFIYAASPAPVKTVVVVSLLLTMHVFLGTVQPAWFCTGQCSSWPVLAPPLSLTVLIWAVAALKFRYLANPH